MAGNMNDMGTGNGIRNNGSNNVGTAAKGSAAARNNDRIIELQSIEGMDNDSNINQVPSSAYANHIKGSMMLPLTYEFINDGIKK